MKPYLNTLSAALLGSAMLSTSAPAQNVVQGGAITAGHAAAWRANGVVGDAGSSAAPTLANQGAIFGGANVLGGICSEDGYNNLTLSPGGYHQLCVFANSLGGGLISYNAYNGAAALPLQFNINGSTSQYPATGGNVVGPNPSVVGNLPSFNNTTGTLLADSEIPATGVPKGRIAVYPPTSWTNSPTTPWVAVVPPGYPAVNCTSTQSSCFVEIFAAAQLQGLSVDIYGPGQNQLAGGGGSTTFPYINTAVALNTGPLVQRYIHSHGVNVTFGTGVTGCGMTINTILDGGYFRWDGQVGYSYNTPTSASHAACLNPTTPAPTEGVAIIANGEIYIQAIEIGSAGPSQAAAGSVVFANAATGSIGNTRIEVGEINGDGPGSGSVALTCFQTGGATSNTGFANNNVIIRNAHNCVNGIVNGSASNQNNYNSSKFLLQTVGLVADFVGTKGIIFDDFGANNHLTLLSGTNGLGAYNSVVKFESGSGAATGFPGDQVDAFAIGNTAAAIVDSTNGSGLHQWKFNGQIIRENKGALVWDYSPVSTCVAGSGTTCGGDSTNSDGRVLVGPAAGSPTTLTLTFGGLTLPAGYSWWCGIATVTDANNVGHLSGNSNTTATFTFPSALTNNESVLYSGCHGGT